MAWSTHSHWEFNLFDKVLLYDLWLHLFFKKLCSSWIGPFIIKTIYPYGAVEVENLNTSHMFKVNAKWLKYYLEFAKHMEKFHD